MVTSFNKYKGVICWAQWSELISRMNFRAQLCPTSAQAGYWYHTVLSIDEKGGEIMVSAFNSGLFCHECLNTDPVLWKQSSSPPLVSIESSLHKSVMDLYRHDNVAAKEQIFLYIQSFLHTSFFWHSQSQNSLSLSVGSRFIVLLKWNGISESNQKLKIPGYSNIDKLCSGLTEMAICQQMYIVF